MCNHYRNDPEAQQHLQDWRDYIGWSLDDPWPVDQIDIWPKRQSLVIVKNQEHRHMQTMAWGVPLSLPGKRPGTMVNKHITNVRNLQSAFWKPMLANPAQRCLVPFTSFAEPKIGHGREEHWFSLPSRPVACFAGIWRPTKEGHAFAFLTCAPNPLIAPLHPKAMPVILNDEDHDQWLTGDYEAACALATPYPSQLMRLS
jgi:putative SOS response-associated peptidase YedK